MLMLDGFRHSGAGLFFLLGTMAPCFGVLTITMDYTNFNANAPANLSTIFQNDSWAGSTPDATRLAAGRAVMDQAASDIMAIFSADTAVTVSQTVSVSWASLDGLTLAEGGTSWNGSNQLTGGLLNWDNDGSSVFFIDTSPSDNTEFTSFTTDQRSINFGGTNINVEDRWYSSFSGAANNSDLYSVAVHEIMHALGVLGGVTPYPPYAALDVGSDGDLDLTAAGNTYEVMYSGGHTTESLSWDGPGSLTGTYYPNVIGSSTVNGTRGRLTDLDALILANIHGFGASDFSVINQPFNTIPIPEPKTTILLALGMAGAFKRKR